MKKLLPTIMLLFGAGAGVGAGLFLKPSPSTEAQGGADDTDDHATQGDHDAADYNHSADGDHGETSSTGYEYARLNNQFIVPVVQEARVTSLVVMSLSVEVTSGNKDVVFQREPRVRDALLQVMFDHANMGGFDGVFTATDNMSNLRAALRSAARAVAGEDVTDVLVLDVLRQELPG